MTDRKLDRWVADLNTPSEGPYKRRTMKQRFGKWRLLGWVMRQCKRQRWKVAVLAVVIVSLSFLALTTTRGGGQGFTETGILQSSNGDFHFITGSYDCFIDGTFGGAAVDIEVLARGSVASPTKVKDVSVAALIGVTAETGWESLRIGGLFVRAEVTGGDGTTLINFQCGRVEQ